MSNRKYANLIIGLAVAIFAVILIVNSYNEQQQKLQDQIRQQQEQLKQQKEQQELLRQQQEKLKQQELERQRQEQLAQEQERQRQAQVDAQQTALNSLQPARNDFSWRLDLVNEQQGRLDTLFEVKAGVGMQQQEYKGWIDALTAAVKEYYVRVTNAVNSGQSYANLLNANIDSLDTNYYNSEIKWIKKNYDIMTSDTNLNKESVNNAINSYNNCFVYKTGCS